MVQFQLGYKFYLIGSFTAYNKPFRRPTTWERRTI